MVAESRVLTSKDELHENRLKFRLIGAAVLIALAVIFLPLIFDGSGTESQFRSMESIGMDAPYDPQIFDENEEVVLSESTRLAFGDSAGRSNDGAQQAATQIDGAVLGSIAEKPAPDAQMETPRQVTKEADEPAVQPNPSPVKIAPVKKAAEPAVPARSDADQPAGAQKLADNTVWLVQTASFRDKINALSLRSELKGAGYAVDVKVAEKDGSPIFRVFVGPVSGRNAAKQLQADIKRDFQRETLLVRQ